MSNILLFKHAEKGVLILLSSAVQLLHVRLYVKITIFFQMVFVLPINVKDNLENKLAVTPGRDRHPQ